MLLFVLLPHFLLTSFINKPDSSIDLTIFISFISLLEIINVVTPDPNFLRIAASVAHVATGNLISVKMLFANGLSTFPIKDNLIFSNGPKSLPKIFLIVLFYVN